MEMVIVGVICFVIGFIAAKTQADKYWVRRIKKNQIPSPENAKFWNP
jgi:hypothetical protein